MSVKKEWELTHQEWEEKRDWERELYFNQLAFYLMVTKNLTVDEALRQMSCYSRQRPATQRELKRLGFWSDVMEERKKTGKKYNKKPKKK